MNIIESLNCRYAVKQMNGEKISNEKLALVLESIRLCPTSLGIQPFEVIIIENQEIKKKIFPIAYYQSQIIDCSHLIVFAFWNNVDYIDKVNKYIYHIQSIRKSNLHDLQKFKKIILNFLNNKTIEEKKNWAKNQTYIALGMALTVCALENIDSIPMEGFLSDELDKILNLNHNNLCSSLLLALGHKKNIHNKSLNSSRKIRRLYSDMFKFIK